MPEMPDPKGRTTEHGCSPEGSGRRSPRPGDLGRRVLRRRTDLGLSREEVAERAAIDPGYLRYVEETTAQVGVGTLLRLADALRTTVPRLLGAGAGAGSGELGLAPDTGEPSRLRALSDEECRTRLRESDVGRVAVDTGSGPMVFPVNYTVTEDGGILFRAARGSAPAAAVGRRVAFEVGRADDECRSEWSVLVVGDAVAAGPSQGAPGGYPRPATECVPWPGDHREVCVRIRPSRVTGRTADDG